MAAKTYEDFPFDSLMTYAGVDTYVTYSVLKKLFPVLVATPDYKTPNGDGSWDIVKAPSIIRESLDVKRDALQFMVDLIVNGIQYDISGNQTYDLRMRAHLEQLEDSIFTKSGMKWNLDSDLENEEILFDKFGLITSVKTKGGSPSTSGDALKEILEANPQHDWLKDLLVRNDVASIHRSFIHEYVPKYVKRDGRVHPNYNLHGTSSHRISGDRPNLLNIPSPKHGYNIRSLYGVSPGNAFLTFDFSSCEVKILAALCKDEKMLEAILNGLDFHSFTASQMYKIPYTEMNAVIKAEDKNDPRFKGYKNYRKNAKAVTFGILYGSSVGGVAMSIGCTPDEAQKIIDSYFLTYPRIKEFVAKCHKEAEWNKWIYTAFNQRKMEYGLMDMFKGTAVYNAALRNAQNNKIQGPASTLGLVAFSKFNKEIKKLGGKSICTVYDSCELEVPIERLAEAIEIGYQCLDDYPVEAFDWLDFKIGCDAEVGYNWGELASVHRGVTQEQVLKLLAESCA